MKVSLISPYPDITNYGLRSISFCEPPPTPPCQSLLCVSQC